MGLDCYIVKGNRDEVFQDERLENCTLTGSMSVSYTHLTLPKNREV